MIVMNDIIMAARYATKTSAFKVEAFQAQPYGQLGTIAGGKVYFEAQVKKNAIQSNLLLPVKIMTFYRG